MSQLSKHLLPVNKELKRKLWPENFQEELKMNERIKELAEQAGIVFWEISGDVDWRQANRENLEKFAELIVRECANVAADHEALDIYEEIREHFGVEE